MFKKLIAGLVVCVCPLISAAGGPVDGIYSCSVNTGVVSQVYLTINGQPNGTSIFAVAAVSPSTDFYGYGIGTATSSSFSGNTMLGQPFSFSISVAGGISGTIGILFNNVVLRASVSCVKIF